MDAPTDPPDETEHPPVDADASHATDQPTPPAGDESTVGTGSVIGIGCLIIVVLVLCVAIAIYLVR